VIQVKFAFQGQIAIKTLFKKRK